MARDRRTKAEILKALKEKHLQHLEAKAVIKEMQQKYDALWDMYISALELGVKYKLELEEMIETVKKMEEEKNGRTDICR